MDDDYMKFLTVLMVAFFISIGVHDYLQRKENLKAIENGYIQVVEGDKILWKKAEQ